MTLGPNDRRALSWLGVSVVLSAVLYFWPSSSAPVVGPPSDSATLAEKRLAKLRDTASTVPAKEEILNKLKANLALREKGLIQADTAPQAEAQLMLILRKLCAMEAPPIDIRSTDPGTVGVLGDAYGAVTAGIQIECGIDQLVNLLAAISQQPELLSTAAITINTANPKQKTVSVHLVVSGAVPRKLAPEKKGPSL